MNIEEARLIARETVAETFLACGVDIRKEGEVKEVQQDFAFMRSARTTMHAVRVSAYSAIATAAVTGVAAAVWHAISVARAASGG